eukprot:gene873-1698_t
MDNIKILKFLLVGLLWGITNPFMKRGSTKESRKNDSTFETLKAFLTNPRAFIPMIINQIGSALFYYILATEDLTSSSLICNALTFGFTGLTGWMLGERTNSPFLLLLGILLVLIGTTICMTST